MPEFIIMQGGGIMSGFDILVVIMGVIAMGAGVFCYVTEQRGEEKEEEENKE